MRLLTQKRWTGLMVVTLIYAIAALEGYLIWKIFSGLSFVPRMLIADITATVVVWLFGVILNNSSVYDPYWSVAPPAMLIGAMLYYNSFSPAVILAVVAIGVWAIRLTGNWIYTFKNLQWQDWRYIAYKANFPRLWHVINFFGINLMPTLFVFGGMLAVFQTVKDGGEVAALAIIGIAVCLLATAIELVADIQMHKYKQDERNKGKTNNKGLWSLSRHPNYFGEISFWFGLYMIMLSTSPSKFYLGAGAIAILLLFIFVSIPLMEKRQQSRRPDYATYKQTTSPLIPLPKLPQKRTKKP